MLAICYEWRDNSVVVVHNFSSRPQQARFQVAVEGGDYLVNLLENDESRADKSGAHRVALESFGYRWYRVGGMGYALTGARDSGAGVKW